MKNSKPLLKMATNLVDSNKSTRLIELDIGYDIVLPITVNSDTGLLYEISETVSSSSHSSAQSQGNQLPLKLNELFPKATKVALSFYVYFLRGKELNVVTRADMIACLNLYSLTGDTNFFETLLKSLFKLWTVLSPVLYSSKVTEETKWELWLRCPFQLLPDDWLEDKAFVHSWRQREDNKLLLLNDDEIFNFERDETEEVFEQGDDAGGEEEEGEEEEEEEGEEQLQQPQRSHVNITKTTSYTRQHSSIVLAQLTVQDVRDGITIGVDKYTSYNDKKQGEAEFMEVSSSMATNTTHNIFIDDNLNGPLEYYIDAKLREERYCMDGANEGLETDYYSSGRLSRLTHFVDNQHDGLEMGYYDVDQSPKEFMKEWKEDELAKYTFYETDGGYVESNYVRGNTISTSALDYKFYDSEDRLKRRITNPISKKADKDDILYADNGEVLSVTTHGPNERYSIRLNMWVERFR